MNFVDQLKQNQGTTNVILNGDSNEREILEALCVNTSVKMLYVKNLRFPGHLADVIRRNRSIEQLCLDSAPIQVLQALSQSVARISALQIDDRLDAFEASLLSAYLQRNKKLQILVAGFEDSESIKEISPGLKGSLLSELRMTCDDISASAFAVLADAVPASVQDFKLELPVGLVNEAGLQSFFLARKDQFTSLDLQMPIDDEATFRSIPTNLQKLRLHSTCNPHYLLLLPLQSVKSLHLSIDANTKDEERIDWTHFLREAQQLESLDLATTGVQFGEQDALFIIHACNAMGRLKHLSLECGDSFYDGLSDLFLQLIQQGTLTSFSYIPCSPEFESEAEFWCELNSLRYRDLLSDQYPINYWPYILEKTAVSNTDYGKSAIYYLLCEKNDILVAANEKRKRKRKEDQESVDRKTQRIRSSTVR